MTDLLTVTGSGLFCELSRYLRERGLDAASLPTPFEGEADLGS